MISRPGRAKSRTVRFSPECQEPNLIRTLEFPNFYLFGVWWGGVGLGRFHTFCGFFGGNRELAGTDPTEPKARWVAGSTRGEWFDSTFVSSNGLFDPPSKGCASMKFKLSSTQLFGYAGAFLVAALLAAPTSVHAAIIWSGPLNVSVAKPAVIGINTVSVNLAPNYIIELESVRLSSGEAELFFLTDTSPYVNGPVVFARNSNPEILRLFSSGDNVDASTLTNWFYTARISDSSNSGARSGYFGFALQSGSQSNYGWGRFTSEGDQNVGYSLTLHEWAYETNVGQAIEVGAVPEPTSFGLLALGALAGVSRWRGRRS